MLSHLAADSNNNDNASLNDGINFNQKKSWIKKLFILNQICIIVNRNDACFREANERRSWGNVARDLSGRHMDNFARKAIAQSTK